jgi:hypothetical protein
MMSFLSLLPMALLFLAALGILVLMQLRPGIGYAWLIGALGSLLAVGAAVFLRWRLPLQITIQQWSPFPGLSSPPSFRLDASSWPYVFGLAVLALAFILTDAARLETEARPLNWAAGLALAGLGILSVMSANPITLVFTWTAVDLVEFLMVISSSSGRRMGVQTVTAFSVRVMGTLLVILAILLAQSQATDFVLTPIPSSLAVYMLLAAGLRLGVLPLNLPYTREVYAWRGLGNVMRMIGPASSLVVLGRMPDQVVPASSKGVLLALTVLAALYGAAMWLSAEDEISGRPYWAIALAAFAVSSSINGNPRASIIWGTALILSGSLLFFFSVRRRQIMYIPLLGMLGIAGLPYTPAAAGVLGLAGDRFQFFTLLFIAASVFLLWGYFRHIFRPRDELYRLERWVHVVYPAGLMVLILAQWVIALLGWNGSLTMGVWWESVAVAVIAAAGIVLAYSLRGFFALANAPDENASAAQRSVAATARWVRTFLRRAGMVMGGILALNWLYRFIRWLYQGLQNVILLLTAMLEGEGGILWALVILALIISLILTGTGGTQ